MLRIFVLLRCSFGVGAVARYVTPVENGITTPFGNDNPLKNLNNGVLSVTSSDECRDAVGFDDNKNESTVSITVVGASGDLAKKKIFPALFALYYEGCLPKVCVFMVVF